MYLAVVTVWHLLVGQVSCLVGVVYTELEKHKASPTQPYLTGRGLLLGWCCVHWAGKDRWPGWRGIHWRQGILGRFGARWWGGHNVRLSAGIWLALIRLSQMVAQRWTAHKKKQHIFTHISNRLGWACSHTHMHILTEVWNLILVVAEEVQCSLFLKEEQVMRQVPPDNKQKPCCCHSQVCKWHYVTDAHVSCVRFLSWKGKRPIQFLLIKHLQWR